jgi:hypothetical protein
MRREYYYLIGVGIILVSVFLLIVFITVVDDDPPVNTPNTVVIPEDIELTNRFQDSTVLTFLYPEGWDYDIPRDGFIIVADPESLRQGTGPTLTIERVVPAVTGSLSQTLDAYLQRGLLRAGTTWNIVEGPGVTTFNDRDAVRVLLEGGQSPGAPVYRAEVVATQGDNETIYIFQETAPASSWAAMAPIFNAILDTVEIRE